MSTRSVPSGRPEDATIAGYLRTSVASVHEARGRRGLLDPAIQAMVPGTRAVGPAVTADCAPGDNLAMHVALRLARPGDVLVVVNVATPLAALWGGLAARQAKARGVAGVILDGGVRDIREVRASGVPVWARHVSALGTEKRALRGIDVPVSCGGVVIEPGDLVVADDDGVVVVPLAEAGAVLERALNRDEREAAFGARIDRGEGELFDLLGLEEVVARVGLDLPRGITRSG